MGAPPPGDRATQWLQRTPQAVRGFGTGAGLVRAVAVAAGRREWLAVSTSRVHFAAMPPREIARYVASGEPFGKAGAYAIQGAIAAWIARIDGSHSGIMGLPLYETATLLRAAGVAVA